MKAHEAAQAYQQSSIENAPPVKITVLLYEGALRFLERAAACDASDPRSRFSHWLHRADAILVELRLSLDHEQGADVARNLEALYLFCEERLSTALRQRSTEPLVEAKRVLTTLLDAWKHVELTTASPA